MTERIHPDHRPLFSSPSSAPAPAAPPKQREQFIHNPPSNDVIYRPSSAYPPPPPPLPPPRRRCCRTCLFCFCAVFAAAGILLGIAVLIFYLVVQPRAPKYTVQDVQIREFTLNNRTSSLGGPFLTSDIVFSVNARNPNKKIGIYYDAVDVGFCYEGDVIGSGSIPSFYQGHKNTTVLVVTVHGTDEPLGKEAGSTLRSAMADGSSIFLRARIGAHIRMKIGGWKTKDVKVVVRCDMEISSPSNARKERLLSKNCKLRKFRF